MALGIFENGIEAHKVTMAYAIEHSGVHVRHVPGYAYTVGCTELGLPELLIEGLPRDQSDELLKILFKAAEQRSMPASSWDEIVVLTPKPTFVPMTSDQVRTLFSDARTHYGHWDVSAVKVVVPGVQRD